MDSAGNPNQIYPLEEIRCLAEFALAHILEQQLFEKTEVKSLVSEFNFRVHCDPSAHFGVLITKAVTVTSLLLRDYFRNFLLFLEVPSNFKQELKLMWSHWLTNRCNVFVKVIDTLAVIANAFVYWYHELDFFLKPDDATQWFMEWFEECLASDFYAKGGLEELGEVCEKCHGDIYHFLAEDDTGVPHYDNTIFDDYKTIYFIENSPLRWPVPQDCMPKGMVARIDKNSIKRVVYLRCESEVNAEINAFQTSNEILSSTDQSEKATSLSKKKSADFEQVWSKYFTGNADLHNQDRTEHSSNTLKKPTCIYQPTFIPEASSNISVPEVKMNVEEAEVRSDNQTLEVIESCVYLPASNSASSSNISITEDKMDVEVAKVASNDQIIEIVGTPSEYQIIEKFSQLMRNRYGSYYKNKTFDYNSCHLISKVYNNSLDEFLKEFYTSHPEKKICIIGRYTVESSSDEENSKLELHDPDSAKLLLCDFKFVFVGQQ